MELLLILLILCVILSASAAVYFFAESKGRKAFIDKQEETISVLRDELRDWQNKALFRQGVTPLGRETEPGKEKDPNKVATVLPRVGHRAQRMARAEGGDSKQAITVHGHTVRNLRVQETVEKAKEIKRQAEIVD